MVEVRAAAEEARAEVARVAEAAGKAALIYSARANASVDQAKVAVVVAVAVAVAAAAVVAVVAHRWQTCVEDEARDVAGREGSIAGGQLPHTSPPPQRSKAKVPTPPPLRVAPAGAAPPRPAQPRPSAREVERAPRAPARSLSLVVGALL